MIPAYSAEDYLAEAISRALRQSLPPAEVIIVEDESRDNTGAVTAAFGDEARLIAQPNTGVAAARNRWTIESVGELVAYLDVNDYWHEDKLDKQFLELEASSQIGLVHCGLSVVDNTGGLLGRRAEGLSGDVVPRLLLGRNSALCGMGSSILVRRSYLDQVGGFDEALSISADFDFCLRVGQIAQVGFVPEPLVYYRQHGSAMHHNVAAMEHDRRRLYARAFAEHLELRGIRRRSLANLHLMLAGSYLHHKSLKASFRHAVLAVGMSPKTVVIILGTPIRMLRRRLSSGRQR